MFATPNSKPCFPLRLRPFLLTLVVFATFNLTPTRADTADLKPADRARLTARAKESFAAAQKFFDASSMNTEAEWKYSRAAFDRAEYSTNNAERAAIAVQGIAACRDALKRESNSAPAHYYLGMNLGQLAQTKTLGALRIVDEMEREFKAAAKLDEHFDHAGPDRNLGLLYFEAPTLGSIGSRAKARKHLERAVELAPDFPENRLNLAEACVKWGDKKLLHRELDALEKLWPAAKTTLAGVEWEASWLDWQQRLEKLREEAAGTSNPLAAPRAKN